MLPRALQVYILTAVAAHLVWGQSGTVSRRAAQIHESAIVVDTHADTPQRFLDENFDLGSVTPTSEGNLDLQKRKRAISELNSFRSGSNPKYTREDMPTERLR
jgi:hypothetical protein